MTRAQVIATAEHYRDWVRIDPNNPEYVLSVPELVGGPEALLPGESVKLRVRRDAEATTVTMAREDDGWLFGFQVDRPAAVPA